MNVSLPRWLCLLFVFTLFPPAAAGAPTAQFWEEVGASATLPAGLSASERGVVPEHRNVSVAIGPDGRPVVAYTDWDDVVVRRWNGAEWEILGEFGSGHLPKIAIDRTGRIVLAWQQFLPPLESWEVYLVVREPGATEWMELGGSGSGAGVSGSEGPTQGTVFSLALGPDGTPFVAYDSTPLVGADFTTQERGLAGDQPQVYVRRWAGPAQGWVFVGSGRADGGASNAQSFRFTHADSGEADVALHGAIAPAIAVGADGLPVVAFLYTSGFAVTTPETFNGLNDDVYVTRWNGTGWVAVGPEVPTGPTAPGLGAPGGASQTEGWSRLTWLNYVNTPVIAVGADGQPVVAWAESTPDELMRVHLRRWSGAVWEGIGGDGVMDTAPLANDVALALRGDDPTLTWAHGDAASSSIYVARWTGSTWTELGVGSASGVGISGSPAPAFVPAIALAAGGAPTVAWIEAPSTMDGGQVHLRTFEPRTLADLVLTALTAPATAHQRQAISVSSTVRNTGLAASRAVTVRFYLTQGAVPGPGNLLLGSRLIGVLAVGASSTGTTAVTIPAGAEPGTWRVLAVVDETNVGPERNDTNNVRASADLVVTPFRPDLTLTAVSVPATVAAGRPLAITHTVRNAGSAPAGAFAIRFYLSADDTLDDTDVLLGARAVGGLGAAASSPAVITLTVPATTTVPAAYRVIAVADALGQQVELDETNNTAVSGTLPIVAYRPDVTVTALTLPATAAVGRPLAITHTVRNVGQGPATAFTIRFYLSADDALDAGDVLLGARPLAGLAAGASSPAVSIVTVPATTAVPATHRVIAVTDALGQQAELDEANNTAVSAPLPITPYRPDLAVTALTVPAGAQPGRPLAVTHTVRNVGPAPAGASTVRFYLSADGTLDAGDVLLGGRPLAGLGAGASSPAVSAFTVPAATTVPATYRVIAVADALEQQTEIDEANNAAVSVGLPMTAYRPDITVSALTVPVTAQAGRPLAITHTVRNVGPAPAGAFTVRFYLSGDETLDGADVLLGARPLGSLAAGAASSAVSIFTLPVTTAVPAAYRVIAVADALEQQTELDEANNTAVSASLPMTTYRPNVTISALTLPVAAQAGRPLAITHTVRNVGPAPVGALTVRFYLSGDETLDGDVLLGARPLAGLAAGAASSAVSTFTVPATTTVPAAYRVIAVADALEQQTELDEADNTAVSAALSMTAYQPDLTLTTFSVPATVRAGGPLAITHAVRNAGPAPAGAFAVRFYLSGDDTLDADDVLLGARPIGALGAGMTSPAVTTLTVPAAVASGAYRVRAVVDALAQQTELDETNNTAASGVVTVTP